MDRFCHCIVGRSARWWSVRQHFLSDVYWGNKTTFRIKEKEKRQYQCTRSFYNLLNLLFIDSESGSRGLSGNHDDGWLDWHYVGWMAVHAGTQCYMQATAAYAIRQLEITRTLSSYRVITKFPQASGNFRFSKFLNATRRRLEAKIQSVLYFLCASRLWCRLSATDRWCQTQGVFQRRKCLVGAEC